MKTQWRQTFDMTANVDFLVVGAQKSGTTALDAHLREHPLLSLGHKKEIHFFDNEALFTGEVDYKKYHQFFDFDEKKLVGECTPIYMYWKPAMERIFQYNARMKIIAVLRNPIERAFSQWNMQRMRGLEALDFIDAVHAEQARIEKALPGQNRQFSYVDRGFYTRQIKNIWRYFPQKQTLFLKHDDFKADPLDTLNQICFFLEIPFFDSITLKDVHSTPYGKKPGRDDLIVLKDIYRNEIEELSGLLAWDCSSWLT